MGSNFCDSSLDIGTVVVVTDIPVAKAETQNTWVRLVTALNKTQQYIHMFRIWINYHVNVLINKYLNHNAHQYVIQLETDNKVSIQNYFSIEIYKKCSVLPDNAVRSCEYEPVSYDGSPAVVASSNKHGNLPGIFPKTSWTSERYTTVQKGMFTSP